MTNVAIKRKAKLISKEDVIKFREDEAKRLFAQLKDQQSFQDNPFVTQYFVIIEEFKQTTLCNHRCILNAKKILVVPRVVRNTSTKGSEGQGIDQEHDVPTYLYAASNLHFRMHFSCPKEILELLKHLCPDAMFVLCQEDANIQHIHPLNHIVDSICSRDFHILRENFYPEDMSFFREINRIMTIDLFPEVKELLLHSMKGQRNERKTAAINIGYSTTDCKRYVDNRLTIFGNIKPFLSGLKISKKVRRSLGQLAVLGFKKIVDKSFIQDLVHDPTNSSTGASIRHHLRHEFAKYLYIHDKDLPYFMAEGIAIVLNPLLAPHKDKLNDPNCDITLTITRMCQNIDHDIKDNRISSKLRKEMGNKMVPFTIIFYSRRVCASYDMIRSKLDNFCKYGKFQEFLIQRILDVQSEANYSAKLFDSNEYYLQLTAYREPVVMPRYYDPMSRYSIVLDMIFRHAVKSQKKKCLTAENLLVILFNLAKRPRNSELHMNIEPYTFSASHSRIHIEIKHLLHLVKTVACGSRSNEIYSKWIKMHERLLGNPFRLKAIEATELIHLMSLMGIVPLEFCMWSSIRFLPDVVQEEEWIHIIRFVKNHVNKLAAVDTLKSIAIEYHNQFKSLGSKHRLNCEEVFGSIRTWTVSNGKCQNIFRLKNQQAPDFMTLSIRAPIEEEDRIHKSTKSIQLTNWIAKTEMNIYWIHPDGCNFALDSTIYIPPGLCKYFT